MFEKKLTILTGLPLDTIKYSNNPVLFITPKLKRILDKDNNLESYELHDDFARDQIDVARKIYQIGNHSYQEAYGEFNPNNPLGSVSSSNKNILVPIIFVKTSVTTNNDISIEYILIWISFIFVYFKHLLLLSK